jgi:enamine deaminase RidA (YjgF/YER057c/UK114 family)
MTSRQLISSGSPWEPKVGYSRAVRVGNRIYVAGTVAADADGNVVCSGDAYGQAKYALERVAKALEEAGASLANVVRTRMFVTDISRQEEFGRAHGEAFHTVRPAATMVEVKALMVPGLLIEIEVDAEL